MHVEITLQIEIKSNKSQKSVTAFHFVIVYNTCLGPLFPLKTTEIYIKTKHITIIFSLTQASI